MTEIEEYENYAGQLHSEGEEDFHEGLDSSDNQKFFEDYDNSISDIDFSQIKGRDFKKSFSQVDRKITDNRKKRAGKKKKPLTREFYVKRRAEVIGRNERKLGKVIVPDDRKVIIEGVNKFILSQAPKDDAIRNIAYYKGKRLQELVLTFNNNSALNFDLELFNPSMPVDYLYSTSLNLNDKVQVAGGAVSYSDVLFNLLANPALIVNAKFVFAGPSITLQKGIPLQIKNKQITGVEKIEPLNIDLQVDNMQVANDIVFFDVMQNLNRPFIPDGMDVIKYTVLAGMSVTMAFFYKQVSLKKVFYEEARNSKKLL